MTPDELRHRQDALRSYLDTECLELMQFYGIPVLLMERQDLLAVICYLWKHGTNRYPFIVNRPGEHT